MLSKEEVSMVYIVFEGRCSDDRNCCARAFVDDEGR